MNPLSHVSAFLRQAQRPPKAPEGWRTPRRCARFGGHRSARQCFGVRWPSTAFPPRAKPARNFKRPLPRSSTANCHWPPGWDIAGECARPGCRFRRRAAAPENSPAIHGWDLMPTISQSPVRDERSLQTATTCARPPRFLPSLAGLFHFVDV